MGHFLSNRNFTTSNGLTEQVVMFSRPLLSLPMALVVVTMFSLKPCSGRSMAGSTRASCYVKAVTMRPSSVHLTSQAWTEY